MKQTIKGSEIIALWNHAKWVVSRLSQYDDLVGSHLRLCGYKIHNDMRENCYFSVNGVVFRACKYNRRDWELYQYVGLYGKATEIRYIKLKSDYIVEDGSDENDFEKGMADCKAGIYDKWFRYNHDDDGARYDAGWMHQNQVTQNEVVTFI